MLFSIFPLITDVTMCDKYPPDDHEEEDEKKRKPVKLPLLTSNEMRKVLDDLGNEATADAAMEEDEDNEFSKVLAEIPDMEGDYSELSLGFNEELCLANPFLAENSQDSPQEPCQISHHATPDPSQESNLVPTSSTSQPQYIKTDVGKEIDLTADIKLVVDKGASSNIDDQTEEGPSKSKRDKNIILYQPPPVPIHKGDLIEFLVGDRTWFLVEVTGRGKIGGKNQNYLNVKYNDGSEGGVYIDQHEWRIVKRKDITMEDSPPASGTIPVNYRLHRVTVDIPSSCEEMSTATEVDTTTDDENTAGEEADSEMQKSVKVSRKRKRRRKRRDRVRKVSVDESVYDPSNSIKKGDIIEYIVKEDDGKVKS